MNVAAPEMDEESTFDLFDPAHHNVYFFITFTTTRTPNLVVQSVDDIARAPKLPKMARFGLDACEHVLGHQRLELSSSPGSKPSARQPSLVLLQFSANPIR
jgi:hypothetical protein